MVVRNIVRPIARDVVRGIVRQDADAEQAWTPLALSPLLWLNADQKVYATGSRHFPQIDKASLTKASFAAANLGIGDFSINCMVFRSSLGNKVIAAKYQDANNYWRLEFNAADKLHFVAVMAGVTLIEVTGNTATAVDTWYSVAVSVDRDSSANTEVYLDGVVDTATAPDVSVATIDNTGAFFVGQSGASTLYTDARIAMLGIWKEALSSANMLTLHNEGQGTLHSELSAPLLVNVSAYYNLNEESVTDTTASTLVTPTNAIDSVAANDLTPNFQQLLQNTGFDSDTIWTKGAGWTIAGGVAHCDGTVLNSDLEQSFAVTPHHIYNVSYTLSNYGGAGNFSGRIIAFAPGTIQLSTPSFNINGSYSYSINMYANIMGRFAIRTLVNAVGDIDNFGITAGEVHCHAGPREAVADGRVMQWVSLDSLSRRMETVRTSVRPFFRTNIINGKNAIEFDNLVGNPVTVPAYTWNLSNFLNAQTGTVAFTTRMHSLNVGGTILGVGSRNGSGEAFTIGWLSNAKLRITKSSGGVTWTLDSTNAVFVVDTNYVVTIDCDGSNITVQINGVNIPLSNTSGVPDGSWFGDIAVRDTISVGAQYVTHTTPGSAIKGYLREFIITPVNLSPSDLVLLTQYLADDIGVVLP